MLLRVITATLATALATNMACAQKLQMFYINGMNNVADDVVAGRDVIRRIVEGNLPALNSSCTGQVYTMSAESVSVNAIFNPTGGSIFDSELGNQASSAFKDAFNEVGPSKVLEEQWLPNIKAANDHLARSIAALFADQTTWMQEAPSIRAVVEKGVARVKASLSDGGSAVVVSHSQGGLIANRVYLKLLLELSEAEMGRVSFVSFGSAANFSPSGFDVKFSNDSITGSSNSKVGDLGNFFSRSRCVTKCRFDTLPDTGQVDPSGTDPFHHNLLNAYFSKHPFPDGTTPRDLAATKILNGMSAATTAACNTTPSNPPDPVDTVPDTCPVAPVCGTNESSNAAFWQRRFCVQAGRTYSAADLFCFAGGTGGTLWLGGLMTVDVETTSLGINLGKIWTEAEQISYAGWSYAQFNLLGNYSTCYPNSSYPGGSGLGFPISIPAAWPKGTVTIYTNTTEHTPGCGGGGTGLIPRVFEVRQ